MAKERVSRSTASSVFEDVPNLTEMRSEHCKLNFGCGRSELLRLYSTNSARWAPCWWMTVGLSFRCDSSTPTAWNEEVEDYKHSTQHSQCRNLREKH